MTGSAAARQQIVTPVRAQPGRYADPKAARLRVGRTDDGVDELAGRLRVAAVEGGAVRGVTGVGYDPCGSNTKSQALYTAMTGSAAARQQIVTPVRGEPTTVLMNLPAACASPL
jgi:hypothetical protein